MVTQRVLLVGATGSFGGRLARHLSRSDGLEIVVASRSRARAEALARALRDEACRATITPLAFDRSAPDVAERIQGLAPWLVIDASGPFQVADYALARAAIAAGAHWLDLADARGYLIGFSAALDKLARERGVAALAGASSTPALSTAVVDELTRGWRRLDTIDIAICPGGDGKVGRAVIAAMLHYAGTPIATFGDGAPREVIGWGFPQRRRLPDLGVRYLSPVETADDALMPARFAVTSRVAFHAGLESRLEHFGLVALSWLRQRGWLRSLQPLAPWLEAARRITALAASNRGGMIVECSGFDSDGQQTSARWWLLAENGDGPHVPVLPALALTRALLAGGLEAGARTAAGEVPLSAIEAEMRPLALTTTREIVSGARPLSGPAPSGGKTKGPPETGEPRKLAV